MSDAVKRIKLAAEAKVAADPRLVAALLAGGAGALGGGALMHARDAAETNKARARAQNVGFGAGVAGPQIIDALHAFTHRGAP
jgi:hypothetical protein